MKKAVPEHVAWGGMTAERSVTPLFALLFPRGSVPPAEEGSRRFLPAARPGQNAVEAYGGAILLMALCWMAVWETGLRVWGQTLPWAGKTILLPVALAGAFLFLHIWAVILAHGTVLLCRAGLCGEKRRQVGLDLALQSSAGLIAAWAIVHRYPLTMWLGGLWLLWMALNAIAWLALRGYLVLVVFAALHAAAFWIGWEKGWGWGLAAFFCLHMVMLYATLVPGCTLFGPVLRRLPLSTEHVAAKQVWLTIDDGPDPSDTESVLDLLEKFEARATFFLIGAKAVSNPKAVERIIARGHGIGNHTQTHLAGSFWALLPWTLAREIDTAQTTLRRISGSAAEPALFRPPAGAHNIFLNPLLKRRRLVLVGWEARGFDGVSRETEKILRRLKRRTRPGSIILIHQGRPGSLEILEMFLRWLQDEGYQCVAPPNSPGHGLRRAR